MEIKTCEEYVLNQLGRTEEYNYKLQEKLEELSQAVNQFANQNNFLKSIFYEHLTTGEEPVFEPFDPEDPKYKLLVQLLEESKEDGR